MLFLSLLAIGGCVKNAGSNETEEIPIEDDSSETNSNGEQSSSFFNQSPGMVIPVSVGPPMRGIGVLSVNFTSSGSLNIYNEDSTVYATLNFADSQVSFGDSSYHFDIAGGPILESIHGFSPRMYEFEFGILFFDCLGKTNGYYEILVHQARGVSKKVSIHERYVTFYAWEDFLSICYITFDSNTNPLRSAPSNDAETVYPFNDFFFRVVEMKDDWIRVECNDDCKYCDKGKLTGWIRWKDRDTLLVQLGVIC